MKASIIAIVIVCVGFMEATAQTGKGNFLVGGSINFSHINGEAEPPLNSVSLITPNSTFSFSPTVGYFVVDNFLIGVQPSVSLGWNSNHKKVKDNIYSVGPVLRYYIPFGKFAAFPELATGYSIQKQANGISSSPDVSTIAMTKYVSFRAGAGIAWFAAPNIGIEGIIAYRKNTFNPKNDIAHGSASWLYFNVGLQFYLNRTNK